MLIPDLRAGCSLATSITGDDVRLLRERYPGVPVVDLRQHLGRREGGERHLLHLVERGRRWSRAWAPNASSCCRTSIWRKYVASQTNVKIIAWKGHCEVHERFTGDELRAVSRRRSRGADHRASGVPAGRDRRGRLHRLDRAHDRLGAQEQAGRVVMVTECSMADNVAAELPDVEFVRPCNCART